MSILKGKWLQHAAVRDAVVCVALAIVASWAAIENEAFELAFEYSRAHEDLELDEIISVAAIAGLLGFGYALRRLFELGAEVKRRVSAENSASWIAFHDPLTSLPNRRMLQEHLKQAIASATPHAVLTVDLDGFKKANDLMGHHGGDQLLVEVADRLLQMFRNDFVARVGGDEFVIVKKLADERIEHEAEKLVSCLRRPMQIADLNMEVGASVGICLVPEHSSDAEEVLRFSDFAMYAAKKAGRNRHCLFQLSMDADAAKRSQLEAALKEAVRARCIEPFYQPLYDLRNGQITGFEALARWTMPDGISVPPSDFIPLAEQSGLIVELSEQLLEKACRDALMWPPRTRLSFNISPCQMTDTLLGLRIVGVLQRTGLSPYRLEIEITESAIMTDVALAAQIIGDLQRAGITIALDDFGTGYSSLAQLSNFQFDKLKIDRSFVSTFQTNEKQRKIVQSIIGLGRGLGISSVAEGIEAEDQLSALSQMGCDFGQGYLMSRPIPASEALLLISKRDGVGHELSASVA